VKPNDLLPQVYDELRRLAAARLHHEAAGQTLDATALVHEAWLRLQGTFENRNKFFAAAAEAMRRILIDNARRKATVKHGGQRRRLTLDEAHLLLQTPDGLLDLDDALTALAVIEPAKAELVKLRFFAGLNGDEAAAALGISPATAERWWLFARTWLLARLSA